MKSLIDRLARWWFCGVRKRHHWVERRWVQGLGEMAICSRCRLMQGPLPPKHVNCRCWPIFYFEQGKEK